MQYEELERERYHACADAAPHSHIEGACCCMCNARGCVTQLLQATAPVKLQVEEALTRGVSSFQDVLQQQKETLRQLQQDYNSYTGQACVHPSVVLQVQGLRFGV